MLYLMLDSSKKHYFAKVGFAKNPKERRKQYLTHSPSAIMRSTCPGTTADEANCRKVLSTMGISSMGTEWYLINEEAFNLLYKEGLKALKPKTKSIHFVESYLI